jgi:hypothetical protein
MLLLDTNVWFKRYWRLSLAAALERRIDAEELAISPVTRSSPNCFRWRQPATSTGSVFASFGESQIGRFQSRLKVCATRSI